MNVSQLISQLSMYPPHLEVEMEGQDGTENKTIELVTLDSWRNPFSGNTQEFIVLEF